MQFAVIGSYLFILLMTSRSQPTTGYRDAIFSIFMRFLGNWTKKKIAVPLDRATHFCEIVDPPLQSV